MSVKIREYINSDRDKICQLLSEFTEYKRDREFWVWINRLIGLEESIVTVATNGDEIIGHYAIVPHNLIINERPIKSGLGIHAFIHPKYRGKVLMYKISELAYQIAEKKGFNVIYGFPNVNYRNIQIKIEGWKEVNLFKSIEINIEDAKVKNNKLNLIKVLDNHSDLFKLDEIISKRQTNNYIRIDKNINYYRNRYISHPQNLYECFFVYDNSEIVAFVVFKIFEKTKGHIIDYIISKDISESEIIQITLGYFKNKVKSVIFWPINNKFNKELNLLENKKYSFETFLGVKFINNFPKSETLIDFTNWELMMGDSDAF